VDLTITKGRVPQPYVSDNVNLEFEYYFGEEWNLVYSSSNTYGYLYEYNSLLCQLVNDSDKLVASNVGQYQCQIELVDSANYTWVEETVTGRNYGGPTRTFNWEIKKRGNIALDYTLKYNGEDIENVYDAVITYDRTNPPQSMEIEITLGVENEPYYRYVNNRTFIYSIECYGVTATLASISTNNTNTITITGISGLTNPHDYLVVTISCDEDDCFEDYEQQLPSIEFIPGELTQEEKDTILAAIPNTTYNNISYSTTTAITIIKDDDQYKISSNDLPDETVNNLGEFVLYYSYPKDYNLVTGKVEFGNNAYYVIPWIDDVSFSSNIDDSITVIQFHFRFEPYNKFIEQIEISATTELYSMK
nr:hypothetical protein [Clostridia bacterium]